MTKTILLERQPDNVIQLRPRYVPATNPVELYLQHIETVEGMEDWQWNSAHSYREAAGCPSDVTRSVWLGFLSEQVVWHLRHTHLEIVRKAA